MGTLGLQGSEQEAIDASETICAICSFILNQLHSRYNLVMYAIKGFWIWRGMRLSLVKYFHGLSNYFTLNW